MMSPLSSCFAVYGSHDTIFVMFPLCLPSSCLDKCFGKMECFPIAEVVLTDVSLSDRLCRPKPGTLISGKFCFQFWKGFWFFFVIMFAAEIQPYCLVEPGRKTQKVKTDIQLMIDGKHSEMQVSLIIWQKVESWRIKMQVFFLCWYQDKKMICAVLF